MRLKKFYLLVFEPIEFFSEKRPFNLEAFSILLIISTLITLGGSRQIQDWNLIHVIVSLFFMVFMSILFLGVIALDTLIIVIFLRNRKLFLWLLTALVYSNFPTIFLYLSTLIFPTLLIDAKYYLLSAAPIFKFIGVTNPVILNLLSQVTPFFAWSIFLLVIAIAKTGNVSYKKSALLAIFIELINLLPTSLFIFNIK